MAIQIGGNAFPDSLLGKGEYKPVRQEIIHTNGQGGDVASAYAACEFRWHSVDSTEWTFLTSTLLNGSASRTFTSNNTLKNESLTETDYGTVTVHWPEYDGVRYDGRYMGVVLRIDQIRE